MAKNKQIHDIVITATAQFFDMSTDDLIKGKSKKRTEAYKRHICFYLIRKNNPVISREFIADIFSTGASTIEHGEKCIMNANDIYGGIMDDVNDIQSLIDNFKQKNRAQLLQ